MRQFKQFILFIFSITWIVMANAQTATPVTHWQRITLSNTAFTNPSVSNDGHSIVFNTGNASGDPIIFIPTKLFISQADKHFQFHQPELVADSNTKISGTSSLRIKNFFPIQISQGLANFNGPMTDNGIVVFGAIASNNQSGIFYAQKKLGRYKIYPIAWQAVPLNNNPAQRIVGLDSPYIQGNQIYYMVRLSNGESAVFNYDIRTHKNKIVLDSGANPANIKDFWNLSLYEQQFAIRANAKNNTGIYRVDTTTGQITRYPVDHLKGFNNLKQQFGGPSLFNQEVTFTVFGFDPAQLKKSQQITPKRTAIYTTAAQHDINTPIAISGQAISGSNDRLALFFNPTLMLSQNLAYISFEGVTRQSPKALSVFLAKVDGNNVEIFRLIGPGDQFEGKQVAQAIIGPVSLRAYQMPVVVQFTDGAFGLYDVSVQW